MIDHPDNLVLMHLRELRSDLVETRADLKTEMRSLRADVASDLAAMDARSDAAHKSTREQIVGLRRAVTEYHSAVVGHGVLISEIDARVRRLEQHLNMPPIDVY